MGLLVHKVPPSQKYLTHGTADRATWLEWYNEGMEKTQLGEDPGSAEYPNAGALGT